MAASAAHSNGPASGGSPAFNLADKPRSHQFLFWLYFRMHSGEQLSFLEEGLIDSLVESIDPEISPIEFGIAGPTRTTYDSLDNFLRFIRRAERADRAACRMAEKHGVMPGAWEREARILWARFEAFLEAENLK